MPQQYSNPPEMTIDKSKTYSAVVHTSKGDITLELFASDTPITVNNFVFLAKEGFYENGVFHRIIKDFMVQGGCPKGDGTGGPGYQFDDEPVTKTYVKGTLAMANAGPNTNGSQFFVMHEQGNLPKNYTIFGLVVQGMDVVDTLGNLPVTAGPSGERSTPSQPPTIEGIEITEET